jgi:hypothetical protein
LMIYWAQKRQVKSYYDMYQNANSPVNAPVPPPNTTPTIPTSPRVPPPPGGSR